MFSEAWKLPLIISINKYRNAFLDNFSRITHISEVPFSLQRRFRCILRSSRILPIYKHVYLEFFFFFLGFIRLIIMSHTIHTYIRETTHDILNLSNRFFKNNYRCFIWRSICYYFLIKYLLRNKQLMTFN